MALIKIVADRYTKITQIMGTCTYFYNTYNVRAKILNTDTGADPEIWKGGGTIRGAAPRRGREGGTPPAQLGGVGELCKLPHRCLGRNPRSQRVLR